MGRPRVREDHALKLRLLYFGIVRERLGCREEVRECRDSITVGQLVEELASAHGIFALGAGSIRIAVNREYVDAAHVLADNDEVAVIPPVAGGSVGFSVGFSVGMKPGA